MSPGHQDMLFDCYCHTVPFAGLLFGHAEIMPYFANHLGLLVDAPAAVYHDSKSITFFHP